MTRAEQSVAKDSAQLAALGDPTRRQIFELVGARPRTVVEITPRVGGHVYDRGIDGSECRWARVLAFEPPHRVLLSWDISPRWQIETDPDKTSEWEVRFIAETPSRTRLELEHRHLERHGQGWEGEHAAVESDQGWPLYLRRFAGRMAREA